MEPLKNILKIYKDKNKVFQEYLDNDTLNLQFLFYLYLKLILSFDLP